MHLVTCGNKTFTRSKSLNGRKTVNCWKNRFVPAKTVGVINVVT